MAKGNWWKAGLGILVVFAAVQFLDLSRATSAPTVSILPRNGTVTSVQLSSTTMALSPGELPGYTGWARPENTLAGFFTITSISTQQPAVGDTFLVNLWCHKHEDCFKGRSLFFLRAYGPSVIPGLWENQGRGRYTAQFNFPDPGLYTVEVVLSFSNSPPMDEFPLSEEEPSYEGYLLPGFPLQVVVKSAIDSPKGVVPNGELQRCKSEQLLETSPVSAIDKARWTVKKKANGPGYAVSTAPKISSSGYLQNINSLGIQMDYEYLSDCTLLPKSTFDRKQGNNHPFTQCGKNIHVVFIGDSVIRVQKERFDEMVEDLSNIQTSYISLHGGYRRVTALEPTFRIKLKDIQRRAVNDIKVVLFNSGLHDIHRLCGNEWKTDRYAYLDKDTLDAGTFSCTQEYRSLLHDFASLIQEFPADLRLFQSTTAAWPKYGNFGIEWPFGGQVMPVATDAIPIFNDIAFDVLKQFRDSIQIMDGYWITYSRPDNREIGTIGNKLSHPGLEVQIAMARTFAILVLDSICKNI